MSCTPDGVPLSCQHPPHLCSDSAFFCAARSSFLASSSVRFACLEDASESSLRLRSPAAACSASFHCFSSSLRGRVGSNVVTQQR